MVIYNDLKTRHMFESYDQKLVVFVFMAIFMSYFPRFLGSSWICMVWQTHYMFGRYDHKLFVFTFYCRLWPFSWAIAHSFGVLDGFACLVITLTCLRDMIRNLSFSRFMVVFMSYCPQIWGSRQICMPRTNTYMFERYDKKPVVFSFDGCFHELLPAFLGF